jgi:hypothetical protein
MHQWHHSNSLNLHPQGDGEILLGSETTLHARCRNWITNDMRIVRTVQNGGAMGTLYVACGMPPRYRDHGEAASQRLSHRCCADARCHSENDDSW